MNSHFLTIERRSCTLVAVPPVALSLADNVCLALITEGVDHGWAIGSLLADDGEIGRIWRLSRPLTYRAIDGLAARQLITRSAGGASKGRDRIKLAPTEQGRRTARAWLDEPVAHLRDVRTELLVKVTLRERAGLATAPLLEAQQRLFDPLFDTLTSGSVEDEAVDVWRRESARAVRRFLQHMLGTGRDPQSPLDKPDLMLSARNQLGAVVTAVHHGENMSTVKLILPDGQRLTAAITREAALGLDIAPGDDVVAVVKSTSVMLAKHE